MLPAASSPPLTLAPSPPLALAPLRLPLLPALSVLSRRSAARRRPRSTLVASTTTHWQEPCHSSFSSIACVFITGRRSGSTWRRRHRLEERRTVILAFMHLREEDEPRWLDPKGQRCSPPELLGRRRWDTFEIERTSLWSRHMLLDIEGFGASCICYDRLVMHGCQWNSLVDKFYGVKRVFVGRRNGLIKSRRSRAVHLR